MKDHVGAAGSECLFHSMSGVFKVGGAQGDYADVGVRVGGDANGNAAGGDVDVSVGAYINGTGGAHERRDA